MPRPSFKQMVDEVGAKLDLNTSSGGEEETTIRMGLNLMGARIYQARPWRFRDSEHIISTVGPYSTGTSTVAQAGTALTGGGAASWTGFEDRKFASGYNAPYYRIDTVGGAQAITLARAYLESSLSGSTYLIYQDEYDIAANAQSITSALLFEAGQYVGELSVTRSSMEGVGLSPYTAGRPTRLALVTETTEGTKRVRLDPTPDVPYGILIRYKAEWVDMEQDSDTSSLPAALDWLHMKFGCLYAQEISNAKQITSEAECESLLARAYKDLDDHQPVAAHRKGFDEPTAHPVNWMNIV